MLGARERAAEHRPGQARSAPLTISGARLREQLAASDRNPLEATTKRRLPPLRRIVAKSQRSPINRKGGRGV
jgi:hypothetical protein